MLDIEASNIPLDTDQHVEQVYKGKLDLECEQIGGRIFIFERETVTQVIRLNVLLALRYLRTDSDAQMDIELSGTGENKIPCSWYNTIRLTAKSEKPIVVDPNGHQFLNVQYSVSKVKLFIY